MFFDKALKR